MQIALLTFSCHWHHEHGNRKNGMNSRCSHHWAKYVNIFDIVLSIANISVAKRVLYRPIEPCIFQI